MEFNIELLERINWFLAGQMPPQEETRFRNAMNADPDLKAEVELQRELKNNYADSQAMLNYKNQIRKIHQELTDAGQLWQPAQTHPQQMIQTDLQIDTPTSWHPNLAHYAMAACLVVAVGLGWYFINHLQDHKPVNIAGSEPIPYQKLLPGRNQQRPIQPSTTSLTESSNTSESQPQLASPYAKLFELYFTPALNRMGPEPKPLPTSSHEPTRSIQNDTNAVWAGIGLLERNKVEEAIERLKPATKCSLPEWQANARWFLALAYLKNNEPDKAEILLTELLIDNTKFYQLEVKELLKALTDIDKPNQ